MSNLHHNHQDHEFIQTPRRVMLDVTATRRWLANLAGVLAHVSECGDSRELVAAVDLLRRAPAMMAHLEVSFNETW